MVGPTPMVGRDVEVDALREALEGARHTGSIVLLRGETGVGKTRLVESVRSGWNDAWVQGAARPGAAPYQPLHEVLGAVPTADPEVHRRFVDGLRGLAADGPAVCVLEDLHHADLATLDVIGLLAPTVADTPLLLLATYDDCGLSRDHGLRGLRTALRRAGRIHEIKVPPLSTTDVAQLLETLAGPTAVARADEVHQATGGLTFFVEEVARALASKSPDAGGTTGIPIPESVSDAILETTRELRQRCPEAVELAAVLGDEVDLTLLATMVPPDDLDQLLEGGLLVERTADIARFRHPLVGAALRAAVSWGRRRTGHAKVAQALVGRGAEPAVVAEHWEAAGEHDKARHGFVSAAQQRCAVHAYRDAAVLARRALALWPHDDTAARADVLEALADCAEKSGDPRAAVTAWHEVIEVRRRLADELGVACAYRRLASAAELDGDLNAAATARAAAADCFAAADDPAAAAAERLALAEHLAGRGQLRAALEHLGVARDQAECTGRAELSARVLAVEGATRAALGQHDEGIRVARAGLDLALTTADPEAIGANYYGFAEAMLHATRYDDSADTYRLAAEYCQDQGVEGLGQACLACMSVAVRFRGDWDRALDLCRQVLAAPGCDEHIRAIAEEEAGLIGVLRGGHRRGQATLRRTLALGERHGIFGVIVGSSWGLAVAAAAVDGEAAGRAAVADLLARCEDIDEWNFALPALRWAASHAALLGERDQLARCQELLARAATHNSAPKVLSVLAHAGAELALVDGDRRAAEQFARSVELLGSSASPYETALVTYRWAVALGAAGEHARAADLLVEAYRTARRLGARPLAQSCAAALSEMGERVDERLGRDAVWSSTEPALTRRERQVLRLVAAGRTNRVIANDLVLSVRTVDMHMRSILSKLDCSSRTAACRRAEELGLLPA